MPRILPGYQAAVAALTPVLNDLPGRVVAIDGRDGVGKTTLGRYLAWYFNVSLIETDLFLIPGRGRLLYRADEIGRLIQARLRKPRPVLVEGVCILKTLQELKLRTDFLVYVENLSEPGSNGLSEELANYERTFTPRGKANVVVSLEHGDT